MDIESAIAKAEEKFPFPGYMNLAKNCYREVAKTAHKYLPNGGKILDFGSGPCDITSVLQTLGYQCSAYDDLSDEWHMKNNNRDKILNFTNSIGIDYQLADPSKPFPFQKNSFDMIMMHGVIEHLHDSPRNILNSLTELLKVNGYLFITVPNAVNIRKRLAVLMGKTNLPPFEMYYWSNNPWRGHVREYTRGDLEQLAKYLNLQATELRSGHFMVENKLSVPLIPLIYRAATCLFPGWRDTWLLIAKKPEGWSPKLTLNQNEYERICPSPAGTN